MSTLAGPVAPSAADVESIAGEVWASVVRDRALAPATGPGTDTLVVGAVSIGGAWRGWVTLEMPVATAVSVTALMLGAGQAALGRAEVEDALGELANMVGGNVKSLVPAPSVLGLPVVVGDPDDLGVGPELCRADLSRDGAHLRVRVWQAAGEKTTTTDIEGRDAS